MAEFVVAVGGLLIERVFDFFQPAQLIVEKLRGLPSLIRFGDIATQIVVARSVERSVSINGLRAAIVGVVFE